MKRTPTGLKKLDDNIEGGFPNGFNILLVGKPGTGKSVMLHHLVNNYLKNDFHAIFVTTDRNKEQLIEEVPEFEKFIENKKLIIIDGYSWKASKDEGEFALDNLNNLIKLSTTIKQIRKTIDSDKVVEVFDIMSEFFLWNNERSIIKFVDFACARARMSKTLAIFVIEKGMQPENAIESLKAITQATIHMGKEEGKRWISIEKVEATDVQQDHFYFKISKDGEIIIQ